MAATPTPITSKTEVPDILTASDLNRLYPQLAAPFPADIVERTSGLPREKGGTGKGYATAGIPYQYAVNRLNEVLGPAHWRASHVMTAVDQRQSGSNRPMYEYVADVTVQIGNPGAPGEPFHVLAERQNYGGHVSLSHADAMKGALTNGIKKTIALFGPGREAYEGTLDDDDTQGSESAAALPPSKAEIRHCPKPGHTKPMRFWPSYDRESDGKRISARYTCTHKDADGNWCDHTEWVNDDVNAAETAPGAQDTEAPTDPRKRLFAIWKELEPEFAEYGVDKEMFAEYLRTRFGVESRSDMTVDQWTSAADVLATCERNRGTIVSMCKRIKERLAPPAPPEKEDDEEVPF